MSYLYIGIGGSGAKLLHTLVHLTAAGLLPGDGRQLRGLLVDADEANGNVSACKQVAALYDKCKQLEYGNAPLFRNKLVVEGPWTPVSDPDSVSLETIFDHARMKRNSDTQGDADLMELLFSPAQRAMSIKEGFRGLPAIGSTVFGKTVDPGDPMWKALHAEAMRARNQNDVSLLLAGSVFGGSGAAGVPTICRLLQQSLNEKVNDLRIGLTLFLPYFTYDKVESEELQANPDDFAIATAEALKYYDEGHFLELCDVIYAVGDRYPAKMPVSAVGKAAQRNPPHYLELIAGMGAVRFMSGVAKDQKVVSLAGRKSEHTVTWDDLPTAAGAHSRQVALLQQFSLFAVIFHYVVYPYLSGQLHGKHPLLDHLLKGFSHAQAGEELAMTDEYLVAYLNWLLCISTPDRVGVTEFVPGLVEINVFAERGKIEETDGENKWLRDGWVLRPPNQSRFVEDQIGNLFVNLDSKLRPNMREILHGAAKDVVDPQARGTGRLVRAIYDACKLS